MLAAGTSLLAQPTGLHLAYACRMANWEDWNQLEAWSRAPAILPG